MVATVPDEVHSITELRNRGGSLDYLSQSVTGTIAASLADAWAMARAASSHPGEVARPPARPFCASVSAPFRSVTTPTARGNKTGELCP